MTDNRARIANVRSILENTQRKQRRRARKRETQAMVSLATPQAQGELLNPSTESEVGFMQDPRLFTDKQLERIGVVHPRSKNRALVDSLRQMRTKLFQACPEGNFTVMVTSVVPEGGASFIALNLASTISFDRTKTSLLIDGNMYDPTLHKMLEMIKLKPQYGLLDYLSDPNIGIENIVSPSGIPRMRIVPIGNRMEGDTEHLTSKKMSSFLDEIKQRYDNRFVVIDAPSISSSVDARVVADLCDFIILVVPYGGVSPNVIETVVDEIDEQKLVGVVLNNEPHASF